MGWGERLLQAFLYASLATFLIGWLTASRKRQIQFDLNRNLFGVWQIAFIISLILGWIANR
jgi:hypothetical protein